MMSVCSMFQTEKDQMVRLQIEARGVKHPKVLEAMREVPRHEFVSRESRDMAYEDKPIGIGFEQTISQPYIVALMTECLNPRRSDRILEIGTGSGYQTAVLSLLVKEVFTVECVAQLGIAAKKRFEAMGFENVHAKVGDGHLGWGEYAPFDGIMVTAAPEHVPEVLLEQLRIGGRMVIPVGGRHAPQKLILISKKENGEIMEQLIELVRFVPMIKG